MLTPADPVDLLLSSAGQQLLEGLTSEEVNSETALRLGERLRRDYPADLVAAALGQHELRLQGQAKFSRAMGMLFTRAGLEQASSEAIARHRSVRYAGARRVADLCTGIGGDLIALAQTQNVLAVDTDPVHLRMARHNAGVYGVDSRVEVLQADVRDVDLSGAGVDAAFVDPARRTGDRRLRTGDSEPPLAWCFSLADTLSGVGVKAAPGLPHELVPQGWEMEFIADGRDLKEAALWSPGLATARSRATILPEGHTMVPREGPPVEVRAPGAYLYDPSPAVTRAGLVEDLARELGAWKIDPQIAFLCTDRELHTPFARTLRVAQSLPWHEKRLAAVLRDLDVGAVDIRRRGLAGDVEQVRRRFKLRGTRRATVVMTRASDQPWALVCFEPE